MTGYNLTQYDRGPHPLAALVGGLMSGAQAGYSARRTMVKDGQADESYERNKLVDAIRLRIDLENAGYNPDDLTPGESPAQEPSSGTPSSRAPKIGTPAFNPNAADPRDSMMPGFGAIDPARFSDQSPSVDPGFGNGGMPGRPSTSINGLDGSMQSQGPTGPRGPGPGERTADPRSRVADILFGAAPRLRKTGESAAERQASVAYGRQTERDRAQDSAQMERERYQQGEMNTRQTAQFGAQKDMNDADNAARMAEERLRRATSLEVAGIRGPSGGLSSDPNVRRIQNMITAQKGIVDGLDRAIRQTEAQVPKDIPLTMTPQQFQAQYGRYIAAADTLKRQRAAEDAKRIGLVNQLMSGSTDFSGLVGGQAGQPGQQGQMPGTNVVMDQERQQYEQAAQRIMALGLAPAEQQRRLEELTRRYNARVGQPR